MIVKDIYKLADEIKKNLWSAFELKMRVGNNHLELVDNKVDLEIEIHVHTDYTEILIDDDKEFVIRHEKVKNKTAYFMGLGFIVKSEYNNARF